MILTDCGLDYDDNNYHQGIDSVDLGFADGIAFLLQHTKWDVN